MSLYLFVSAVILIGAVLITTLIWGSRYLARHPGHRAAGMVWWLCASPFIALGAYLVIGLAIQEHHEHRLGLGTGVLVVAVLAVIKGFASGAGRRH